MNDDSATRDRATVKTRTEMVIVLRQRVDRVLERDASILTLIVRNKIAAAVAAEVFGYLTQLFDIDPDKDDD